MQSHLISNEEVSSKVLCSAWRAVPAPAIRAAEKDDWSEAYDVVIIGSGFAGLAAAYSAAGKRRQVRFSAGKDECFRRQLLH